MNETKRCKHCGKALIWHHPDSWVEGRWAHADAWSADTFIRCDLQAEPE